MNITQVVSAIDTLVQDALKQRGLPPQSLTADTLLLGASLGIDSLDLAAIVVQLTEETGKDPFEDGFVDFRTVGELAQLYAAPDGQ
jgi:acyl carrier protein